MAELPNKQHERFAKAVAVNGLKFGPAARHAGFSEANSRTQGHRLAKRPEIMARIDELRTDKEARRSSIEDMHQIDDDTNDLEPASIEWLTAKRVRGYYRAEANNDLGNMDKMLSAMETAKGMKRSTIDHNIKADPLAALPVSDILMVAGLLRNRLAILEPPTIEGEAEEAGE